MKRTIALLAIALAPILATAQAAAPLNAVLMNNLDARKAKVGDTVKVRSYSGFSAPGGQRVPPGAVIIGHVTEASRLGKGSFESRLAVVFDQAQLSGGQTVPLHMGIAGLAAAPPVQGVQSQLDMSSDDGSSFPGARSTGYNVDPTGQRSNVNTTGGTGGTRVTRATPEMTDPENRPRKNPLPNDPVAPVASVGSTVPGIALKSNPARESTLVSTANDITLRSGTPLVLLPIAGQQ
ncbi:hypothetical protein [Terriglobus sp. ADX1]|uniref:hypothetical protein n=1 Tax=Terriglobus sp. ADX1 TaxID=2794063 RepID=UPI002FE5288B